MIIINNDLNCDINIIPNLRVRCILNFKTNYIYI